MAKGPNKRINGGIQTTRAQYSSFRESFTPGWDKGISGSQEQSHVRPRAEMGNKMTPRGASVIRKAGR